MQNRTVSDERTPIDNYFGFLTSSYVMTDANALGV